ncbi:MAG: tetratricopeptide repeat protein [Thermodesulfobacteriota bacterium]
MTNKFSSKEIRFLKNDSEDFKIKAPETYFSDLLWEKNIHVKTFKNRLLKAKISSKKFLCAVIQVSTMTKMSKTLQEKLKEVFEETFNSVLENKKGTNKRGIWESLNNTSFVFAFWDYKNEKKASQLIISLKEKISTALKADILIGVAKFPHHDFSIEETFNNAIKAIDHAAFFGPDTFIHFDATSLNISGDRLYQLNRYKMALNEYQKGLEIEPDNINLINSLGVCFGVMGELAKAKLEFKKAIKINPNEVMVIYNIGLIYQIEEDIDKAVIYLRKAHGIDSAVFEVELLLGSLLIKKNQPEQALPHLEKAGGINPESGLLFRMKGEIYLGKKLPEKAGREFNKAIKINPGDAISLSGYARSLELQDKNLHIARSFAQKSIDITPGNKLFQKRLKIIQKKMETNPVFEKKTKTA